MPMRSSSYSLTRCARVLAHILAKVPFVARTFITCVRISRVTGQLRVMHNVRAVNGVHWWHPIVKTQWEVLVQQIGAFIWTVDGVERERWLSGMYVRFLHRSLLGWRLAFARIWQIIFDKRQIDRRGRWRHSAWGPCYVWRRYGIQVAASKGASIRVDFGHCSSLRVIRALPFVEFIFQLSLIRVKTKL